MWFRTLKFIVHDFRINLGIRHFAITLVVEISWFTFVTWSCKTTLSKCYERYVTLWLGAHPPTFFDHKHCGSGDIMVLVYHVISQDHVITGPCDFMGRSPWRQVSILQSLVGPDFLIVELWLYFVKWSRSTTWSKSFVIAPLG